MDIFRISSFEQFPVKLKMNLCATNLLLEEYPLSEKYLKNTDHNEWVLETMVCGFEGVGRFIMGLLPDIEIVESEKLKQFIREKVKMAFYFPTRFTNYQ